MIERRPVAEMQPLLTVLLASALAAPVLAGLPPPTTAPPPTTTRRPNAKLLMFLGGEGDCVFSLTTLAAMNPATMHPRTFKPNTYWWVTCGRCLKGSEIYFELGRKCKPFPWHRIRRNGPFGWLFDEQI